MNTAEILAEIANDPRECTACDKPEAAYAHPHYFDDGMLDVVSMLCEQCASHSRRADYVLIPF